MFSPKLDKKKNATLLNNATKVINNFLTHLFIPSYRILLLTICSFYSIYYSNAQNLFSEECFIGSVTGGGYTRTPGAGSGSFNIHHQEDYTIRRAFGFTYRYGRPDAFSYIIEGQPIFWESENQVGSELNEAFIAIQKFATHVQDVTDLTYENLPQVNITMLQQNLNNPVILNEGWWSLYMLFLAESPLINDSVCIRAYVADQVQYQPQNYTIATPPFQTGSDIGFSIYSDRISGFFTDRSRISINNQSIGEIWGVDATNPESISGVRGHFYYQNGLLYGLDDDVPNNSVNNSDGIAVINSYLQAGPTQAIQLRRVQSGEPGSDPGGFNPHPAFFITYKPACILHKGSMSTEYILCQGDTVQLESLNGYEHYAWNTSRDLSDSSTSNPLCFADSSRWYTVRMWNDDPLSTCAQTIPVYVTVNPIPEPANIAITPSTCPANTGRVVFQNPAGIAPFSYSLNGVVQGSNTFNNLSPGSYTARILNGHGCTWESIITVPLITQQQANFNTFPQEGDSPLYVYFHNQSTGATSYQWLIDGEPYTESFSFNYTFADTGTYVVNLIAYLTDPACADTATVTIRVNPGIRIALPNIFTPNGDGTNDRLVAELFGVSSMRWEVHNRWGNLLFSGNDSSGAASVEIWDGTANGNMVPSGVYPVQVTVQGLNGKVESVQVMVTLAY